MPVTYATAGLPSPDWVMVGVSQPDGSVVLIASKELTRAELEAEADQRPWPDPMTYRPPVMTYRVSADMRTFVWITAPDYPAAFALLFSQWQPERARRPEIDPARRALSGPDGPDPSVGVTHGS